MNTPPPKINLPGADKKKPRWDFNLWPLFLMFLILWAWQAAVSQFTVRSIPYSEFRGHLARHEVKDAIVKQDEIVGQISPNASAGTNRISSLPVTVQTNHQASGTNSMRAFQFRTVRIEDPDLVKDLQASGAQYNGVRPSFLSQFLLSWVLPIAIMVGIWSFMGRKLGMAGQSIFGFGKSTARLVEGEKTGISFADVAGCDEAKQELKEVIDFLKVTV